MDSFEKFNNRELPTKDQFYSILNDEHITDDEYIHAKEVWDTFYIKTISWLIPCKRRAITNRCIWELQKDLHAILQIRSMSLFHKSGS